MAKQLKFDGSIAFVMSPSTPVRTGFVEP